MKRHIAIVCAVAALGALAARPQPDVRGAEKPTLESQWKGRKVAFLGDSITDKCHVGCRANYWNFLPGLLGLDAYVYGKNGWRMAGMLRQAQELKSTLGDDVDAIFVFAGTNDFNSGVPLGEWYVESKETVRKNADMVELKRRTLVKDESFRGCINRTMEFLKREFPRQQIVLLTPIHRSFAQFGERNVQPDEAYANAAGLYLDAYVAAVREAGAVWSVPVIDLYSECGLYPSEAAYIPYFNNAKTDRLHPNDAGHRRIAATMAYRMMAMPASFR